jgi:uncharacterized protein (DUF2267 family)
MTVPQNVLYASHQFGEWLADLKERAALETHNQAYAMFRAVLIEVRDRLPREDVAAFGDLLPPLVRGLYYEGWSIGAPRPERDPVESVRLRIAAHHTPPDTIIADVLSLMSRRLEPREGVILKKLLPAELRAFWPARAVPVARPLF